MSVQPDETFVRTLRETSAVDREVGRMEFKLRVVDELQKLGVSAVIVAHVLAMSTKQE